MERQLERQTQSGRKIDTESETERWNNGATFFVCTPTDKYKERQADL